MHNSEAGATYLVLGASFDSVSGFEIDDPDYAFTGDGTGRAGFTLASAGDVNGDGQPDIMIGASNGTFAGVSGGTVYLLTP